MSACSRVHRSIFRSGLASVHWRGMLLPESHMGFQPGAPQGHPAWTPALCPYANLCENKSAHQLLFCAHFVICPGTLRFFCTKCNCNAVSKASSNFWSGLLVQNLQSLHILFWWMALFFCDLIGVFLCATSTMGLMPPPPKHFSLELTKGV